MLTLGLKTKMKRYNAKKRGWHSKRNGFSLLDVVIASIVLLIAIVGTASYRRLIKCNEQQLEGVYRG
jgi:Tfp pilus assembly protein PilV